MRQRSPRLLLALALIAAVVLAACATNTPPVADAGPDQSVAVGTSVTLDAGGSSDPDGDTLAYRWELTTRPDGSGASLDGADAVTANFTPDLAGDYVATVTVDDGSVTASDSVTVSATTDSQPPAPEPSRGTLEPGGTFESDDGTVLAALGATIEGDLAVRAGLAAEPATPLPASATRVGDFVEVGADADVFGERDPFVVALPIPEGADTSSLALAVLLRPEDVTEGEDLEGPFWQLLPGVVDADDGYFVSTLPLLPAEGRIVVLVSSSDFASPELRGEPGGVTPQQTTQGQFNVSCATFGDSSVNNRSISCDANDEADLETVLEDAYADYTGIGFVTPYLQREIDESASSFSPNNATIVFGDYLAELRPFRDVSEGESRWPCGSDGSLVNLGGYSSGSQSFFVCIDDSGVTTRAEETGRHEYFHATQFGYAGVRGASRTWILEGTASASENSLATMARDTSRPLRVVDVPLEEGEDPNLIEYEVQDFFVYTGLRLGEGLDWLDEVFTSGATTSDVDSAIQTLSGGDELAEFYWGWVKNQAFEKSVDLGGGVLGAPCTLLSAVTDDRLDLTFGRGDAALSQTLTLEPLTARVVRVDFDPFGSADYRANISTTLPSSDLRAKIYAGADAGTTACQGGLELPQQSVTVRAGDSPRYHLLVANTSATDSRTTTVGVEAEPIVTITQPTTNFREGESTTLQAYLSGFPDTDTRPIRWSYEDSNDVVTDLGTTSVSGESFTASLPCDSLLLTAEADDPAGGVVRDIAAVGCTPQTESFFLNADRARGGYVNQDGTVTPGDTVDALLVGDDAANNGLNGFVHFTLGTLPDDLAQIRSATLTLSFESGATPPNGATELIAVHGDYGTLDADDFRSKGGTTFLPGLARFSDLGFGSFEVDVTTAVRDAWEDRATRGEKVQFLLYFDPNTDSDGTADLLRVSNEDRPGTTLLPGLTIEFDNF